MLTQKIKQIPGVLESGIFLRKPDVIYKAKENGKFVSSRLKKKVDFLNCFINCMLLVQPAPQLQIPSSEQEHSSPASQAIECSPSPQAHQHCISTILHLTTCASSDSPL